ncbi:MAG: sodium:proton antiporter [Acidobacteria bacterium]|nr:MAG: sodium:proton antiporter [Acidobacteriota bacterium]
MAEESFRGLAIVAGVAFFVPLLLGFFPRLRLPSVVLEIAVGAVIGPSVLGWVHVDGPIQTLSRLGLASLLFLAGLEIEVEQLRGRLLKVAAESFLLSVALSLTLCYALWSLRFLESPLFVAILLASTALGVVVPILKDANETASHFGQLLIVAISIADFGTIILLALLFSAQGASFGKTLLLLGSIGVLCAMIVFAAAGVVRWRRLTGTLARLQDTTAMIRIRGAAFLLIAFLVLVEKLGLEIILGAFVAGSLLGFIDRDEKKNHPLFRTKLQAVGFGVFVPVFFVTSGIQFNLRAFLTSRSALLAVPLFLAVLLIVRGAPALLYRADVGTRDSMVAGLLQATSLPFIVAGVRIGVELGRLSQGTGAALIAAGMLSVLIFPVSALTLLRRKASP